MEHVLRGAESARRLLWRLGARTALGRACLVDRSLRTTVVACAHLLVALGLAVAAPLWLLLVGPLVLGVPHLVSDVRYLVLAPSAHVPRRVRLALALPLLAMTAMSAVALLGGPFSVRAEVAAGFAAVLGAVAVTTARPGARAWGLVVCGAVGGAALVAPAAASLLLAHLHNLVALGLWLWWRRGEGPPARAFLVCGVYAAASALLLSGALEPASNAVGAYDAPATGLDLGVLGAALAPDLSPALAARLVQHYAFAQAVHYALWLRLIPNTAPHQPRQTPPSLRRALRALVADLGRGGARLALGLSLLVPLAGLFHPTATREAYLYLVLAHGWLELAVIAHRLVRRRAPCAGPARRELR